MSETLKRTKRQLQAENTRRKITHSARKLILDRGFDNVTIEDIAVFAGTSKGTFYTYFKSKRDIIFQEYVLADRLYKVTFQEFLPEQTVQEKLAALVDTGFRFCADKGIDMTRIVYSAQVSGAEETPFATVNLYKMVDQLIKQGIENGEICSPLPAEVLLQYFAISHRAVTFEWCLRGGDFDLPEVGRNFMKHTFFKNFFREIMPSPAFCE